MRIVTLDSRVLQERTLSKIKSVPYFGSEKCDNGRGFKSNMYNFDNKICILDDLCYPSNFRDYALSIKLVQLSNIVAVYDQISEMYWVIKNRHLGREGWHTQEEFGVLVMKELNPVKFQDDLSSK